MAGKRPINADLPAPTPTGEKKESATGTAPPKLPAPIEKKAEETKSPPAAKPPEAKRIRKPVPTALKAIGGLVLIAVVFLVAAVLGGGGSNEPAEKPAPAPVQAPPEEAPEEKQTPSAEAAEELGYPSFATNNTTRVGGEDAATTAAGVALAVFPSAKVVQRPTAVTLVDEDDWQGAVAAAVLMSAPVRAPLLVTAGGDVPDPTSQALAALDPQGSSATGKAQAFVVGSAATPGDLRTTKIAGNDPADLAVATAELRDELLGGKPRHIVIAPESDPAFAMPAAAWAARSGDPVLFSGTDSLPKATVSYLRRRAKVPVFVLGPSAAISSKAVREIGKLGNPVRRVSGEDPVENAIALARYASGSFGWNVNDPGHGFVVARSDEPLLGAIAAPLSASGTWGPLLLSDDADTLPAPLREYFLDIKPGYTTDPTRAFYNHVWVIGDQEAISVNQQAEIDQLAELAKIGGGEE
ncbi:MAG TPA: cell wall-binding repeat-containing protein [Solirubrobacterales bacterium]|nr:cell wall-binding repeat-containing protein [Solirubrobacterales bacterium]